MVLIPFPCTWAGLNDSLITNRIWQKSNVWLPRLHHEMHCSLRLVESFSVGGICHVVETQTVLWGGSCENKQKHPASNKQELEASANGLWMSHLERGSFLMSSDDWILTNILIVTSWEILNQNHLAKPFLKSWPTAGISECYSKYLSF